MAENIHLNATARVKLIKCDGTTGEILGVEEHEVKLTEEEAKELWRLRQPE
jgi:hypothetical protein